MRGTRIDQACPVCGTPEEGDLCTVCRWRMRGDPVLGDLTEEAARRAADALAAAAHGWDVRAAALCGSVAPAPEAGAGAGAGAGSEAGVGARPAAGEGSASGRLAAVVRGGLPEAGPGASRAPGDQPAGPWEEVSVRRPAQWLEILDDLIFGRVEELLFVEFDPDRVNVIKAYLDESGIPRQKDAGSVDWETLAPALDPHPEIRRFQLAGGIGEISPVDRRDFDAAVLRRLTASLPPPRDRSTVLLVGHPGWTLLDRAVATLRRSRPLRAELHRRDGQAYGTTTTDAVRGSCVPRPFPWTTACCWPAPIG